MPDQFMPDQVMCVARLAALASIQFERSDNEFKPRGLTTLLTNGRVEINYCFTVLCQNGCKAKFSINQ